MLENPTLKKRYIPKHDKTEEGLQRRVCSYLRKHYPHVVFRSDYASGLRLTRNQAMIHKSLQSSSGWPDLFLYLPITKTKENGEVVQYGGLALELKVEGTAIYVTRGPRKGKLVADPHIQAQAQMLKVLNVMGYCARFAVGYDKAIQIIDWYMGAPENETLF
jgi:hypothetical protein